MAWTSYTAIQSLQIHVCINLENYVDIKDLSVPSLANKTFDNFDWPYKVTLSFWPGLGLPSQRPMVSYQKNKPCQNIYEKKRVKVRSTTCHYAMKKRPVKITMYLGLDIIISLKFTTDFDRCAILNELNYLTKNFES